MNETARTSGFIGDRRAFRNDIEVMKRAEARPQLQLQDSQCAESKGISHSMVAMIPLAKLLQPFLVDLPAEDVILPVRCSDILWQSRVHRRWGRESRVQER